ncbi:MAG: hypothetical protein EBR82_00585 [Caulobacteraceae bacterium]|nr:hypothetical protein [Caulobacteraceae bacterium]
MPQDRPIILLLSDFSPLYEGDARSSVGDAVFHKEVSKLITARAACSMLINEESLNLVKDNKQALQDFVSTEKSFILQLNKLMSDAFDSLNILTYKDVSIIPGFYGILAGAGYRKSDIQVYSATKLWQQSLLELKYKILSHTRQLLVDTFTRNNVITDKDQYQLSDVVVVSDNVKRLWIYDAQDLGLPTAAALSDNTYSANNQIKLLNDFSNSYLINIANRGTNKEFLSNSSLDAFQASGRDISVLANCLFKEFSFSEYLSKKENRDNLMDEYGYSYSSKGNHAIFDYLIGNFNKSVLLPVKKPVGNGKSLVGLSQDYVSTDKNTFYNVLTFENTFNDELKITPGSYYYIDSSVSVVGGNRFDTSRITKLVDRCNASHDALATMVDMLGYDMNPPTTTALLSNGFKAKDSYVAKDPNSLSLGSVKNSLSLVSKLYSKLTTVSDGYLSGIDPQLVKSNVPLGEQNSVRLAAIICKSAIEPHTNYASVSQTLKYYLFASIMSVVSQQVDGTNNSVQIDQFKGKIAGLLQKVLASVSPDDISLAASEGRTIVTIAGTAPSVNENVYNYSQFSDIKLESRDDELGWSWTSPNKTSYYQLFEKVMGRPFNQKQDAPTRDPDTNEILLPFVDEMNAEISQERRQAYFAYTGATLARTFAIDFDRGLWKSLVDCMSTVYKSPIYDGEQTFYSGMNRTAYMFAYFDMLLRIVAAQTPENLAGFYTTDYNIESNYITEDPNGSTLTIHNEAGYLIDSSTSEQVNELFEYSVGVQDTSITLSPKRVTSAVAQLDASLHSTLKDISLIRNYVNSASKKLKAFKDFLNKSFQTHIGQIQPLYASDKSLTEDQKNALINLSLTEEQIIQSQFIGSEISDRLNPASDLESKLLTTPYYANFPTKFTDYVSVNDIDTISYPLLSSYFKSADMQGVPAYNKKIMSIGMPQRHLRALRSITGNLTSAESAFNNVIKLYVYKIDWRHPSIVYSPKKFLFETRRFPTRELVNWKLELLDSNDTNLLDIPTKLFTVDSGFVTCKDFDSAFPTSVYGSNNFLSLAERQEIISNHAMSFILDEYLRWFTDAKFDETRYTNFSPLSPNIEKVEMQYESFVNSIPRNTNPNKSGTAIALFEKSSKQVILSPDNPPSVPAANQPNGSPPAQNYVIPSDSIIRDHFYYNDTLLLDVDSYKRRMLYPKKFDRVFNILIDPDDFYVDIASSNSTETGITELKTLIDEGVLINISEDPNNPQYRHRDTSDSDVSLDEYFVSVVNYDYSTQYEI